MFARMKERKPYSSNVSDGEWNFVAPYVALVTERVPTLCANCLTHCVGWYGVADAAEWFAPWPAVYQPMRQWLKRRCFRGQCP